MLIVKQSATYLKNCQLWNFFLMSELTIDWIAQIAMWYRWDVTCGARMLEIKKWNTRQKHHINGTPTKKFFERNCSIIQINMSELSLKPFYFIFSCSLQIIKWLVYFWFSYGSFYSVYTHPFILFLTTKFFRKMTNNVKIHSFTSHQYDTIHIYLIKKKIKMCQ